MSIETARRIIGLVISTMGHSATTHTAGGVPISPDTLRFHAGKLREALAELHDIPTGTSLKCEFQRFDREEGYYLYTFRTRDYVPWPRIVISEDK